MTAPALIPIKYRSIPRQFNRMAICQQCDRDASEVQFSHFVASAIDGTPLICDNCRKDHRP